MSTTSPTVAIAPSILSADMGRLAAEVAEVRAAGAEWIHVDVMDGRFVPNITIGPGIVSAVRAATDAVVDVHLMIVEPDRYLEQFAQAGADVISVHAEACPHLHRTLAEIRRLGCKAGVALNPHTSEEVLRYLLEEIDMVLVMSVNPGFGGQSFIPSVLPKITRIRDLFAAAGRQVEIQVDGGIGPKTAGPVVAAGATVLVAGNAVYGAPDRAAAVAALRAAAATR